LAAPTSGTSRAHGHCGLVVASEADDPDPDRHAGWNVVPWVNAADTVVAIEPQIVPGLRITPDCA
jgi:hypothetical protein